MIFYSDTGLLADIKPYSVIIHQANCVGSTRSGLMRELAGMYPAWEKSYKEKCGRSGSPEYLLGQVHAICVGNGTLVCSMFTQRDVKKVKDETDYDAWELVCQTIESQVLARNKMGQAEWTVHIRDDAGKEGGGDWNKIKDILEYYFGNSKVNLYIHKNNEL